MNFRRLKGATLAGALGTVIIIAHLILALFFGLKASQWVGGAGAGLLLVIASALHIILSKRRRRNADLRP